MTMTFKKQTAASVDTPDTGYVKVFADSADSLIKGKDDVGVVRPIGNEVATDLATTGSPVAVDGGAPPSAIGNVLVSTVVSPPAAEWQNPAGGNPNFPFVEMVNESLIDNADSPFAAIASTMIPVDLSAGNVEVDLPLASSSLNREICVKMMSETSGNTITLDPAGTDTIDGDTTFVMDTDYEWIRLRALDLGGGNYAWAQIG